MFGPVLTPMFMKLTSYAVSKDVKAVFFEAG